MTKLKITDIQVDTTKFMASLNHDDPPRGIGHWAFDIGGDIFWVDFYGISTNLTVFGKTIAYSKAVKKAKTLAKSMGIDRIYPLP